MQNCEIDYESCWKDLKRNLVKYLEEKGADIEIDDINPEGRYCIALSINDIFTWMNGIENSNIKSK